MVKEKDMPDNPDLFISILVNYESYVMFFVHELRLKFSLGWQGPQSHRPTHWLESPLQPPDTRENCVFPDQSASGCRTLLAGVGWIWLWGGCGTKNHLVIVLVTTGQQCAWKTPACLWTLTVYLESKRWVYKIVCVYYFRAHSPSKWKVFGAAPFKLTATNYTLTTASNFQQPLTTGWGTPSWLVID